MLAAVCATAGTFSTYGLAGHLRWSGAEPPAGSASAAGGWRFWQPLKGGAAFVATQALVSLLLPLPAEWVSGWVGGWPSGLAGRQRPGARSAPLPAPAG